MRVHPLDAPEAARESQRRLRAVAAVHPAITMFSAHDPAELTAARRPDERSEQPPARR